MKPFLTAFPTLCGCERSVSQRVVDGADQQSHVLMSGTVHRPLAAGHVHVVVQAFDAVHHRLSRRLDISLLGQLCCYHGNNFLQQSAKQQGVGDRLEGSAVRPYLWIRAAKSANLVGLFGAVGRLQRSDETF